jgi:tetratricopeptide (TPR) repeat protein
MVLAVTAAGRADDHSARQYLSGLEAYKAGDYARAVENLRAIAEAGVSNGKLFYNLGNAYLKNNDLGRALLWYERARALLPDDPDLNFNLAHARSQTKDAAAHDDLPIQRILFFWKYQLSPGTIKILAIAFNLLFWAAATAYTLTRRRGLRRTAYAVLLPALLFVFTAAYNYCETAVGSTEAIVLPEQAAVRSGLQASSTELFQLHAGAKVKVLKRLNGHVQVRFSKDKIGWLPQDQVGLI